MAIFLLLGGALGEGVITVVVDGIEGVRTSAADEDEYIDDVDDGGDDVAELGVREASVVERALVREGVRVVCGEIGPEPREKSKDEVAQHPESSFP